MIIVGKGFESLVWRRMGRKVLAGDTVVMVCSTRREAHRIVFQHNQALSLGG